MRKTLLVLLLTGCATTPNDLRELGDRETFTSSKSPRDASLCMTRNAENFRTLGKIGASFPAHWREGLKAGTFELLVPNQGLQQGFVLVAEIEPRNGGSHITTWVTRGLISHMSRAIVEGCD